MEGFPYVSLTRGLTVDGRAAMACGRLWEAANDGAAVCRTDTFGETRIIAWLTVWGGFEHLCEARDAVSLETGDARKVYGFDSDGYLIKTRNR
jgi:hypothetical protein